jgi:hypothetical protein
MLIYVSIYIERESASASVHQRAREGDGGRKREGRRERERDRQTERERDRGPARRSAQDTRRMLLYSSLSACLVRATLKYANYASVLGVKGDTFFVKRAPAEKSANHKRDLCALGVKCDLST